MKKILYIHGLGSYPLPERLDVLKARNHQVFALHLDYENEPNTYQILSDYALENQIDFIVGSSAGGYIGYWLGHDLGVDQLLFNPAVAMRDITQDVKKTISEQQDVFSWVVAGVLDERVPHNRTVGFFQGKTNARVVSCQWLEHEIDLPTFIQMVRWCGL